MFFRKYKKRRPVIEIKQQWRWQTADLGKGGWRKFFGFLNIILIIAVLAFVYYFLFSDKFRIKHIEVQGINILPSEEIYNTLDSALSDHKFFFFKSRNIFLTKEDYFRQALSQKYIFANLSIKKIMPDTLLFDIEEHHMVYRVQTMDHEYLVDDQGTVDSIGSSLKAHPGLLSLSNPDAVQPEQQQGIVPDNLRTISPNDQFILLYMQGDQTYNLADKVLSSGNMDFIQSIIKLPAKPNYPLRLIILPGAMPEYLIYRTEDNWDIYFNLNTDLAAQLRNLDLLIDQKITVDKLKRLEKIDMRLGDNIYFKFK